MKKVHIISGLLLLNAVLISCSAWDDVIVTPPKQYDLAFSMGHQNGMRMANDVVQTEGQEFRGLQKLWVIPFETTVSTTEADAVTVNDFPLLSIATATQANKVEDQNYYYIGRCSLKQGTNRVLVYGQAKPIINKESSVENGKLLTRAGEEIIVPADITFSLQPICEENDPEEDIFDPAWDLANYLTAIAHTTGWSTTDDSQLKALYLDFIHSDSEGTGLMAGSATHVKAYASALNDQLVEIKASGVPQETKDLCDAIIERIGDVENEDSCVNNGYPSDPENSLGLPDGAAALRWIASEDAFLVRTMTTTLDNINGINRYTYPAELWYYVNSTIKTSDKEVGEAVYQGTSEWSTLLAKYDEESVAVTTKSAAVVDPLQYGVGRLQMTLNEITASSLKDSKNANVIYSATNGFKLTGVIIGGQHTVGFDFKPMGEQSNVDARFIYDTQVGNHENNAAITVNTLVLQSYDGEKVPVILEMTNKTGQKFAGKDGIIYPNTKFYLVGEINPAGQGTGVCANRVFTQDYTTEVTMTITSLANAYSCMPDLLSPRLEIGVQVQTKWVLSTPTAVKL
ncbi:MAG: hypothetical protein IKZ62_00525 [Prevotella sp.]|nr:hypothetical protein [Prevotella sp.]